MVSLMFHHFHDESNYSPSQGSLSAVDFKLLLDAYFQRYSYTEPNQLVHASDFNSSLSAITLDDGLRSHYDIALNILEALELRAFFFVNSAHLEDNHLFMPEYLRYIKHEAFPTVEDFNNFYISKAFELNPQLSSMFDSYYPSDYLKLFTYYSDSDRHYRFIRDELLTITQNNDLLSLILQILPEKRTCAELAQKLLLSEDQIRSIANRGHIIGCHTHSHPTNLDKLNSQTIKYELQKNRQILADITGTLPMSLSYPCGKINSKIVQSVKELDFSIAFLNTSTPSSPYLSEIRYHLPRFDHSLMHV